ncbi:MAG: MerR family transcriptional regulator [Bacteroidales bacterium]|nr:MerR family transcriptional regulator [Bacteroidales bacterium]
MKNNYSIANLSEISGIEIQTIRVWENRYGIFTPQRSKTNIREYSYQDYIKIIFLSFLTNNNFRIGKIAELNMQQLREKVHKELLTKSKDYPEMNAMTLQLLQGDTNSFADYLLRSLSDISPDTFVLKALVPLIKNLDIIDHVEESNIGNKLLVKNIIQKYLIVVAESKLLNSFYDNDNNNLLILRGDTNIISINLVIVHFLAVVKKYKSDIFLNLLEDEYINVLKYKLKPDIVYTEFNEAKSLLQICDSLDKIESAFPKAKLIVSGKSILKHWKKIPNKVYIAHDLEILYKSL